MIRAIQVAPCLLVACLLAGCAGPGVHRASRAPANDTRDASAFPWTRYEAEDATTTGTVIGPSREYRTPESESSGRRSVRLGTPEETIAFSVTSRANALVVRYCIPDSPRGDGLGSALSIAINDDEAVRLSIDSRFAWVYGSFPWYSHPAKRRGHLFFDERRTRLPEVRPGDVITVSVDGDFAVDYCLVDFVETEWVEPPLSRAENSLSLLDFDAVPDDGQDDTDALRACIAAAESEDQPIWIPPGTFNLNGGPIELGGVRIGGAGIWHTTLTGSSPMFKGTGEPVMVSDLSIDGHVDRRFDARHDNAFTGNFGNGSRFRNLWIEHMKCGFWTTHGTSDMRIENCRIRNTMADGINLCDGTSSSTVLACHVRNTGDDALATWSPSADWSSGQPCKGNAFVRNLIETPWHANGIAIYGGGNNRVEGNTVIDTVYSGAGIMVSSGHGALPFFGTIAISNNTVIRTGGASYINESVGSLWLFAQESDIEAEVQVDGLRIVSPTASGISIHGPHSLQNVSLRNVEVIEGRECGVRVSADARGHAIVENLSVTPVGTERVVTAGNSAFQISETDQK